VDGGTENVPTYFSTIGKKIDMEYILIVNGLLLNLLKWKSDLFNASDTQ